jgi:hypothetical protein
MPSEFPLLEVLMCPGSLEDCVKERIFLCFTSSFGYLPQFFHSLKVFPYYFDQACIVMEKM